jgi:hypothetical protein
LSVKIFFVLNPVEGEALGLMREAIVILYAGVGAARTIKRSGGKEVVAFRDILVSSAAIAALSLEVPEVVSRQADQTFGTLSSPFCTRLAPQREAVRAWTVSTRFMSAEATAGFLSYLRFRNDVTGARAMQLITHAPISRRALSLDAVRRVSGFMCWTYGVAIAAMPILTVSAILNPMPGLHLALPRDLRA